jgi:hypothetical protein
LPVAGLPDCRLDSGPAASIPCKDFIGPTPWDICPVNVLNVSDAGVGRACCAQNCFSSFELGVFYENSHQFSFAELLLFQISGKKGGFLNHR